MRPIFFDFRTGFFIIWLIVLMLRSLNAEKSQLPTLFAGWKIFHHSSLVVQTNRGERAQFIVQWSTLLVP